MTEEKNRHISDRDIEDLLSTRCEFHVSSGFQERVTGEATKWKRRKSRRLAAWISSAVVAVASVILFFVALHDGQPESPDAGNNTLHAHAVTNASNDTLKSKPSTLPIEKGLVAKAEGVAKEFLGKDVSPRQSNRKTHRKSIPSKVRTSIADRTASDEHLTTPVKPVGPMTNVSKQYICTAPDPAIVRKMNAELQNSAEIAYIERVRQEIEETDAYIIDTRENIKYISENRLKQ